MFGNILLYNEEKCIKCGKCIEVCPKGCHTFDRYGNHLIDRNHCITCGKCVEQCVVQALKITGQKMSAEEVVETAGYVNFKAIEKSLPDIDLLLWDIKETDEERHRKYTGGVQSFQG